MTIEEVYDAALADYGKYLVCVYVNTNDSNCFYAIIFPTYEQLLNIYPLIDKCTPDKKYFKVTDIRVAIGFDGSGFRTGYLEDLIEAANNSLIRINPSYQHAFDNFLYAYQNYESSSFIKSYLKLMEQGTHIKEIKGQETSNINIEKLLSKTEQKAFSELKNYLPQGEGSVSISQLCFDTKISRPVYKSLFQKLKECGLIEIKNQGVNGTYIKFISRKDEV